MDSAAAAKRVLVVGPDAALRRDLAAVIAGRARVDSCATFRSARAHMDAATYDLIVTDVRLGEYNGVHLAHLALLAASGPPATRAIVYDKDGDPGAARAAHQAGAFFEVASRLLITLPAYLGNPLPPIDRRSARASDRRAAPRGGRRLWDIHLLAAGVASL